MRSSWAAAAICWEISEAWIPWNKPSSQPASKPQPKARKCATADKKIKFYMDMISGFQGVMPETACMQFEGASPNAPIALIGLQFVSTKDAGPEKLLNAKPDGAKQFALAVMGPIKDLNESETIKLLGQKATAYRLRGYPHNLPQEKELVIVRIKQGDYNIVGVAMYPAGQRDRYWKRFKNVFESLEKK